MSCVVCRPARPVPWTRETVVHTVTRTSYTTCTALTTQRDSPVGHATSEGVGADRTSDLEMPVPPVLIQWQDFPQNKNREERAPPLHHRPPNVAPHHAIQPHSRDLLRLSMVPRCPGACAHHPRKPRASSHGGISVGKRPDGRDGMAYGGARRTAGFMKVPLARPRAYMLYESSRTTGGMEGMRSQGWVITVTAPDRFDS